MDHLSVLFSFVGLCFSLALADVVNSRLDVGVCCHALGFHLGGVLILL